MAPLDHIPLAGEIQSLSALVIRVACRFFCTLFIFLYHHHPLPPPPFPHFTMYNNNNPSNRGGRGGPRRPFRARHHNDPGEGSSRGGSQRAPSSQSSYSQRDDSSSSYNFPERRPHGSPQGASLPYDDGQPSSQARREDKGKKRARESDSTPPQPSETTSRSNTNQTGEIIARLLQSGIDETLVGVLNVGDQATLLVLHDLLWALDSANAEIY